MVDDWGFCCLQEKSLEFLPSVVNKWNKMATISRLRSMLEVEEAMVSLRLVDRDAGISWMTSPAVSKVGTANKYLTRSISFVKFLGTVIVTGLPGTLPGGIGD